MCLSNKKCCIVQEICEVEMEEVESPLRCIDKSDNRNPLAVVEYVDEIYSFYRKTEVMIFLLDIDIDCLSLNAPSPLTMYLCTDH